MAQEIELPEDIQYFVTDGAWQAAYDALRTRRAAGPLDTRCLHALATAAYMIGREEEFVDLMTALYDAHMNEGQPLRAVRAAFWIGLTLMFRGEHGRGGGWLAKAAGLLDEVPGDCVERGYVMLPQVEMAFGKGDPAAAEAVAKKGLQIAVDHRDDDLAAMARHLVGRARLMQGDIAGGMSLLDETMIAVTSGRLSPIVTGLIYCSVIAACQRFLIFQRAREWTRALSGWCAAQPELVAFTGRCLIHRSEILNLAGDWDAAEAEASAAGARLESGGSASHLAGQAHYQRGEILRLRGQFGPADACYRQAAECGFDPQPGLALMRLAEGRAEPAMAAIRRALSAAEAPVQRLRLLPAGIEIALSQGERETAASWCDELVRLTRSNDCEAARAQCDAAQAALALAAGDIGQALRLFDRAIAGWRDVDAPYAVARLRLQNARACAALDDRETALAEARAARDTFSRLGAVPDLQEAEALLGSHDSPVPSLLTPRQTEVLSLMAKGLTNREIAERLGLSTRTVDRHVSDILTRIDAPTRAAATAYAVANGLIGPGVPG